MLDVFGRYGDGKCSGGFRKILNEFRKCYENSW